MADPRIRLEFNFDEMTFSRAVQNVIDTGNADLLGQTIARGLLEGGAARPPDRDQLAAMAMQGLLPAVVGHPSDVIARTAYAMADAMLAERAKGKP